MLFAIITFLSALFIEGIGTYISILGLSALFAFNPIIIAMAVALDIGKLVAVSFVYKYWAKINWVMKSYMTAAAVVLVFITSMGAFGFLSAEFQKAIAGNSQQNVRIEALTEEKARLQARKEQIDQQVANLPANYGRTRINVINSFKEETQRINARLAKIDEELPQLKVENIEKSVKIGPILYVANAFGTTPEIAVKWVILTIIFVFDPLAIALILAGNFLWAQREQRRKVELPPPPVVEPLTVQPLPKPAPLRRLPEVAPAPPEVEPPAEPKRRVKRKLTIEENPEGNDVIKVEAPQPPPPASSLEAIDARRGDVTQETDVRHAPIVNRIAQTYTADLPPAVVVGGPPTRISE